MIKLFILFVITNIFSAKFSNKYKIKHKVLLKNKAK